MAYCKKCFEHITNDCILTNDICVFCYYKTNEWESNGKILAKKEALQNWQRSFLTWRNYYIQYYKDIRKAIKNSPKGVLVFNKIKGHRYCYLLYRDGKKIRYKYYGKEMPKDLQEKIKLRKKLIKKLSKIKLFLSSLRITKMSTVKINNFHIFKRDNYTCQYCGKNLDDKIKLHVDHILPLSKGGSNQENNLITACQKCNLEEHDRH